MGNRFKNDQHWWWAPNQGLPMSPREMGKQKSFQYQPHSPLALAHLSHVRHARRVSHHDRAVPQRSRLPSRVPLYHGAELQEGFSLPQAALSTTSSVDQDTASRRSQRQHVVEMCKAETAINYRRMSSINQTLLGLDNRAMEETHRKIFDILEGAPQASKALANGSSDTEEDNCINIEKLKKVIRQLEREESWLHHFTNIIPVVQHCDSRSAQRESFLGELDKIHVAKRGFISRDEFKLYNASIVNSPLIRDDDKKLLKLCKAIADAKKIYCFQTKLFVPTLSLLLITIFILGHLELVKVDGHLRFDVIKNWQAWRYFTYSFVHADWKHLILNLLLICVFGGGIEAVHGSARVAILYFIGVVCSSLVFFCFSCGTLIGCSGGIYCLMAAALANTILNWKEDKAILWKFRKDKVPFAMAGRMYQVLKLVTIFTFATFDFGSAAYRVITGGEDSEVSVLVHIFGFLTGLLAGFIVCMDRIEEKWEKMLKQVCWTIFCLALGFLLAVNLLNSRSLAGTFSRDC